MSKMMSINTNRFAEGGGAAFAPLAVLFAFGAGLRHLCFNLGFFRAYRSSLLTISVGGLTAGGAGKTPVAEWIIQQIIEQGLRPALLSRGYKRALSVPFIRKVNTEVHWEVLGDEPAMMLAHGFDIPMGIAGDRVWSSREIEGQKLANVLVLDDGFSHRRLARDLDIVVLNGDRPFGNGHFLPWGTLREAKSSLKRADCVCVVGGVKEEGDKVRLKHQSRKYSGKALLVFLTQKFRGFAHCGTLYPSLPDGSFVLVSGIARPQRFYEMLEGLGVTIKGRLEFSDHHFYSDQEVQEIVEAVRNPESYVLTTAKDWVRLSHRLPSEKVWVADLELVPEEGGAEFEGLIRSMIASYRETALHKEG
ncbi:MAG: tetraacyldisaccharide 4'-kinase [Myxococcota bacterium]|nr:tetraacyldisaccharide 4'-kinase [Myxococcota bacterium]